MDVLDDDDQGALLGEGLEETAPCRERVVPTIAAELRLAAEADQCEQMRLDASFVTRAGKRALDGRVDLLGDFLGRVLFEHTRLSLHDLAERPERDSVAVRQAASLAPRDQLGVGVDKPLQLVDEATLSDAGDADEGQELRRSLMARALERVPNDAELALAADEVGACLVRHVDAEAGVRREGRPDADRLRLPLRLDGLGRLVVDGDPRRAKGRLVDDDPVHRRRALEACRRVDDIA